METSKLSLQIINLRMETLSAVRQDYINRGYKLSDSMLANTLKYVYDMFAPVYK